ncbi:MAG: glycoside hydrolase family 16 protein [Terracidiphilus sp.]|nr:glycoside hydrolase family 16 protein [Terracidiphilus sp.]
MAIKNAQAHFFRRGTLVLLLAAAALLAGCRLQKSEAPSVRITRVPSTDAGGPDKTGYIEGEARGTKPGDRIVLYAHSGIWWVQPFAAQPLTTILADHTWKNSTHLGTDYAALLVDSSYRPAPRSVEVPKPGNGVLAVAVSHGQPAASIPSKTIHFSGFDWQVRAASSDRGGEANAYSTDNAWTDGQGALHLRMAEKEGKWSCAEVALTRNLGYGTYRFVVEDTSHLDPSAVVSMFTWDDIRSQDFRNELDIELSRWGNAQSDNAQYVVQPFYVPENVARFAVPSGVVTHTIRWEPNRVTFRSYRGTDTGARVKPISEHVFTSGVPTPSSETVHINLYEFHHSRNRLHTPADVVIQRFEYLP